MPWSYLTKSPESSAGIRTRLPNHPYMETHQETQAGRLLTIQEAAERCGCTERTIRNYLRNGRISGKRTPRSPDDTVGQWLIPEPELDSIGLDRAEEAVPEHHRDVHGKLEGGIEPLALKRTEVLVIADDLLSLFQERIQPTFQEAGKAGVLAENLEFTRQQMAKLTEEHAKQALELGRFQERTAAAERESQALRDEVMRLRAEADALRAQLERVQSDLEVELNRPLRMGELFWGRRTPTVRKEA